MNRVPKKKKADSPNYKHVQVVRKHDERKKLATASCKECQNVFINFNTITSIRIILVTFYFFSNIDIYIFRF